MESMKERAPSDGGGGDDGDDGVCEEGEGRGSGLRAGAREGGAGEAAHLRGCEGSGQ